MRIYIQSAPEDLAIAQQLADLVAQQPAVASTQTVPSPLRRQRTGGGGAVD